MAISKKMKSMCAGCRLSNLSICRYRELVYSFPVDEPFKVIHADVFTLGADMSFSGHKHFMVIVCGLCTFAVQEPLLSCNSTTFSDALMKIMLTHGLAHTIIVDKDSKFMGVFIQTMKLLQINIHLLQVVTITQSSLNASSSTTKRLLELLVIP